MANEQAKSLIEDTIRRNQSPLPREEVLKYDSYKLVITIIASRGGVILSNGGGSGDDGENGDGGPLMIIMVAVVGRRHMFRQ